jgi:hypothetical protein
MILGLLMFLTVIPGTQAAVLGFGTIVTPAQYGEWHLSIASVDDRYSIQGWIFGATGEFASSDCVYCDLGELGAVTRLTAASCFDCGPWGRGSGIIDGVSYESLLLQHPSYVLTELDMITDLFTITGTGFYRVPFTMRGILQASTSFEPLNIVLDEQIRALGTVSFDVKNYGGPTTYGVHTMTWDFVIIPEPDSGILAVSGVLLLLLARRTVCKLRKPVV